MTSSESWRRVVGYSALRSADVVAISTLTFLCPCFAEAHVISWASTDPRWTQAKTQALQRFPNTLTQRNFALARVE
jgi:hypothetical protein